ncbi:MAG: hypothetical protein ACRESZ_19225, partial [Methylococcales bacterium]
YTISSIESVSVIVKSALHDRLAKGQTYYIEVDGNIPQHSDGDNISDVSESAFGLDPNDPDSDGDGIVDGVELVDLEGPENRDNNDIIDGLDPDDIFPVDADNDGLGAFRNRTGVARQWRRRSDSMRAMAAIFAGPIRAIPSPTATLSIGINRQRNMHDARFR